ncbi:hypothetical protein F0562_027334 [Nyssa sinensis]|uniref:Uncharacterized protein n=1 Tax=Nyssa sinensis TaxID=561372 RepID=A0A5J5B5Y0_9ASTE|nr:hypothetical protein F0562_027334 [Nyssa sinensis]
MKPLKLSYCPKEKKSCARWVEEYFNDCLCNLNDGVSFSLGLASLICWGVAEIPQIITNFKNKSGHGVSLAFIFTWIVGDVFNLVGCVLEPATVEDESKPLQPNSLDPNVPTSNTPVEVPPRRDFYYMSARSLAGSATPPLQSYIKAKSGPSALEYNSESSSEDEKPVSQPRKISWSVGYGSFLAASAYLPHQCNALSDAFMKVKGRRLVQGLNPFMFIFALIANVTYVGSILVRSREWKKIKANLPWLLDAIVCVALDLFAFIFMNIIQQFCLNKQLKQIIFQYIYYRYMIREKVHSVGEYNGDYEEAEKAVVS